jgi:hypothetical protein
MNNGFWIGLLRQISCQASLVLVFQGLGNGKLWRCVRWPSPFSALYTGRSIGAQLRT